jgi:hypothetical protein
MSAEENHPAFWKRGEWTWRWLLVLGSSSRRLHRIASFVHQEKVQWVGVSGAVALCGKAGDFRMPGMLTRMYGNRCPECARLAGVAPETKGAPYNRDEDEAGCEGPRREG